MCQAAQPELSRNLEMQTALAAALAYNGAKAVKAAKTKAKVKAVKTKLSKDQGQGSATGGGSTGSAPPSSKSNV